MSNVKKPRTFLYRKSPKSLIPVPNLEARDIRRYYSSSLLKEDFVLDGTSYSSNEWTVMSRDDVFDNIETFGLTLSKIVETEKESNIVNRYKFQKIKSSIKYLLISSILFLIFYYTPIMGLLILFLIGSFLGIYSVLEKVYHVMNKYEPNHNFKSVGYFNELLYSLISGVISLVLTISLMLYIDINPFEYNILSLF